MFAVCALKLCVVCSGCATTAQMMHNCCVDCALALEWNMVFWGMKRRWFFGGGGIQQVKENRASQFGEIEGGRAKETHLCRLRDAQGRREGKRVKKRRA